MQDHEVHHLAQVQMDFHWSDSSSVGSLVPRDPVLLSACRFSQFRVHDYFCQYFKAHLW